MENCAANSNKSAETRSKSKGTNSKVRKKPQEREMEITKQRGDIHGPNHAIPVANNEPMSWPSVAPAPINPNNLEPD